MTRIVASKVNPEIVDFVKRLLVAGPKSQEDVFELTTRQTGCSKADVRRAVAALRAVELRDPRRWALPPNA